MFFGARVASGSKFRLFLLASASLLPFSGSALGADLPVKAPPPPPPVSWAGFYLGLHGGYGWKQDDFSFPESNMVGTPSINGVRSQGAVYGAQAGYNWQFGSVLTGIEIDFSATDIQGRNAISGPSVFRNITGRAVGEDVQYLASARARLGWAATGNLLVYGTAGLAWERVDIITEFNDFTAGTVDTNRTPTDKFGWVAGVGAEVMLGSPNWVGRIEYLHYDMSQVQNAQATVGTAFTTSIFTAGSQTIDVVRGGVSYKFGEAASVAPVRYAKAPVAAPLSPWAGFYIGAHGGYGWGDAPLSQPTRLVTTTQNLGGTRSDGWVAGGHFGHNWQYDRVVAGLEADLSATGVSGRSDTLSETVGARANSVVMDERTKYLGTVRGRLGWLPASNILLYGTAGVAWERIEIDQTVVLSDITGTTTNFISVPNDRLGWVAGFGGEMMLGGPNWIGRLEYLHYDFDRVLQSTSSTNGGVTVANSVGRQTIDILRGGVSYKFGQAGPLTAMAMYGKSAPPAMLSWAGFYIGAHGGYGWAQNSISQSFFNNGFLGHVGPIDSKGWLAGGHAGYNWQYASAVAGIEIDGDATGIRGTSLPSTVSTLTETLSDDVKYLGTLRARVGWTPAPSWLLYATGGLAWERNLRQRHQFFNFVNTSGTTDVFTPKDQFGWVAGVGVEALIGGSNWVARVEYLHYDFGNAEGVANFIDGRPGGFTAIDAVSRHTIDTVRGGLSYKFTP